MLEACARWSAAASPSPIRWAGSGVVDPDDVRRALRPETVLIASCTRIMNLGTIQPVAEIAAIAAEARVSFPLRRGAVGRQNAHRYRCNGRARALAFRAQILRAEGRRERSSCAGAVALEPLLHGGHAERGAPRGHRKRRRHRGDGQGRRAGARAPAARRADRARCATGWNGACSSASAGASEWRRGDGAHLPNTTKCYFPASTAKSLVIALDLAGHGLLGGRGLFGGRGGSFARADRHRPVAGTRRAARVRLSLGRTNTRRRNRPGAGADSRGRGAAARSFGRAGSRKHGDAA